MKRYHDVFAAFMGLLLTGCCCQGLKSCSGPKVIGSEVAATERRDLGAFSAIECAVSAEVKVTRTERNFLVITADDNLLPIITTEVRGETLVIKAKENYSSKTPARIEIGVPKLSRLEILGSSDFSLDSVTDEELKVEICGSGAVAATGAVDLLEAKINGSGDLKLKNLQAKVCRLVVNGSGDAEVSVSAGLDVRINGSGKVEYHGNPESVDSRINGSGRISKGR